MAPRGRKKQAGLMRVDAARDAMKEFGFEVPLINACIKELLEVYGEEGWRLIEEFGYQVLLEKCLEKQGEAEQQKEEIAEAEQDEEVAEEQNEEVAEEHNEEIAEEHNEEISGAEQEQTPQQEKEKEQEQHVEDGRDHAGSNSTSLVGCGAETGTQISDALSITSETDILDSSPAPFPAGEASVIDYASPVPSADALEGYALHSAEGAMNSRCGWLSEEETDPDEDSDGDDDEMIHLTPQPLCEELEELLREIQGEKKRKTRWED